MPEAKIKIGADHSRFSRSMGRIKGEFRTLGRGIKSIVSGPLQALGVALSFGAAVQGMKRLIASMDELRKSAGRMGVTTDEVQALGFAARRSGVDASLLETAIARMNSVIDDAATGNAEATKSLTRLGTSAEELMKLPVAERMQLLAQAISGVGDAGKRSALAQDVFGRSGSKLLGMMKELTSLSQEFRDSGAMITDEQLQAAERYGDAMENLSVQLKKLAADSGSVGFLADLAEGAAALSEQSSKGMSGAEWVDMGISAASGSPIGMLARLLLPAEAESTMGNALSRSLGGVQSVDYGGASETVEERRKRRAEAEKRRVAAEKAAADEIAAAEKAAADAKAAALAAEAAKQASIIDATLQGLRDQAAVQALINAGREREAEILEETLRLQKQLGRELTPEEAAKVATDVGALVDVQAQKSAAEDADEVAALVRENDAELKAAKAKDAATRKAEAAAKQAMRFNAQSEIFRGGLAAIGGGGGVRFNATPPADVERNRLLTQTRDEVAAMSAKLPQARTFA